MPPKGRRKAKDDPFVADEAKEEPEPEKLNLEDAAGIKKALDAAVIEVITMPAMTVFHIRSARMQDRELYFIRACRLSVGRISTSITPWSTLG